MEINVYSDYTKNELQALAFAALTSLVYKVGIWLTMFTMDWQINQGIVLALQLLVHRHMKAVW